MRDQLHVMELVDRYLDGAMNAGEAVTFEARLKENAELRSIVDDQRALREGMHRLTVRAAVMSGARQWTWHKWWPKLLIGGVVIAVGVLVFRGAPWFAHQKEFDPWPQQEVPQLIKDTVASPMPIAVADSVRRDTTVTIKRRMVQVHVDTIRQVLDDTPPSTASTAQNEVAVPTHVVQEASMPADEQPQYPGGFTAMYDFLKQHIRYPDGCTMSGTVMVSFVIDEQGIVREPKVVQALEPSCDAEALRVITQLPRWTPATHDGKPVKSSVEVPLQFKYVGQVLKF